MTPSPQRTPSYSGVTLYGLGYLPFSASIASLLAATLYFVLQHFGGGRVSAIVLCCATVGVVISATRHREFVSHDPRQAVSDEFIGMLAGLVVSGVSAWWSVLLALVIFRVLDLLKPFPFSWLDKRLHGAYGYLVDDAAIGVAIGIVMRLAHLP